MSGVPDTKIEVNHSLYDVVEGHRGFPAQNRSSLCRVTHHGSSIGRTQQSRVSLDTRFPLGYAYRSESRSDEVGDRMRDPGGDDEVVALAVLGRTIHRVDVVGRPPPITLDTDVTQHN